MSTAGFHITEDCAEIYLQNESGTEFLPLARRLHDYLQQGQRLPARSFFEATDGCKEISREAFDALAKRRMENTGDALLGCAARGPAHYRRSRAGCGRGPSQGKARRGL